MTMFTPVLYFGENSPVNETNVSFPQDWQFCVVYEGLDSYNLHGYRNSTDQTWDMTFLSRESLARFLLSSLSSLSTVTTTLYVVDEDSLYRDNFENYYSHWNVNNELYSYENLWSKMSFNRVMDHLLLLRDTRVN